MAIELPPIYVNEQTGGGIVWDLGDWEGPIAGFPPEVRQIMAIPLAARGSTLNGDAVWSAAATNDARATTVEVAKGLSGQSGPAIQGQLALHAFMSAALGTGRSQANGPYVLDTQDAANLYMAYGQVLVSDQNVWSGFGPNAIDFVGDVFMPITGIGYWLFGNGITRKVQTKSLDLHMNVSDFSPIQKILSDSVTYGPGPYTITEHFEYNTFSHQADLAAAGLIGRISGTVYGTLIIGQDGSYTFSGEYNINDDVYDAPTSNRTWQQEALTTFLRDLGEVFGHTDYTIQFLGNVPIQFSGYRN